MPCGGGKKDKGKIKEKEKISKRIEILNSDINS